MPPAQFAPWASTVAATAKHLKTSVAKGLTTAAASKARAVHGPNELAKEDPTPLWRLVLEQFDDVLVKVLLAAAAVSFGLAYFGGDGDEGFAAFVEPAVIVLILVLNAVVGVWQESNAERALEALKELQSEHAKTYRDGALVPDLPAADLVPGDVVELATGDRVPADLRLVACHSATVRLDQASLTGESDAVAKHADALCGAGDEIQAKECMLFSGTAVAAGSCVGIVTATGASTEIGRIHGAIADAAEEQDDTPLKKKLDAFGVTLTQVIGVVCLLVWLINYAHFVSFDDDGVHFSFSKCTYYFKIAVALAVAAIPEGLPTVITTCLALGTRKMVKKNAIVRKLPSVETLGCTTVICSDKTGTLLCTLTTNQMSCVAVVLPGASARAKPRALDVAGTSYDPRDGGLALSSADGSLDALCDVAALCNAASLRVGGDGRVEAVGAPTEAALLPLVEKADGPPGPFGPSTAVDARRAAKPRSALLDFDRDRKSMSVLVDAGGANALYVKGATESVLDRCAFLRLGDGSTPPLTAARRKQLDAEAARLSGGALRVLALAEKRSGLGALATYGTKKATKKDAAAAAKLLEDVEGYAAVESGLTFVGLVGLRDPPRPEVPGAIEACGRAGVRVIVITGDNKLTAEAVCASIGVLDGPPDDASSITGAAFARLARADQKAFLGGSGGRVFSRAEPTHKQDIVRLLKERGDVVAMTGDGVNDAPALKLADIGIAMGITGTEVAKEASDMVLADDNFSSIVAAIAEGRAIYTNMKAFIRYMISSNVGEVASIFLTAALGFPEGLIPVQLLWVNLVTDGPPATALGFNPPDADNMVLPPRRADDALLTPWILVRYFVVGAYVGVATVGVFAVWFTRTSFLGIDLSRDGHSTVTLGQLATWGDCEAWDGFDVATSYATLTGEVSFDTPCDYFRAGKVKASTLSLSVLVSIEMFNALNALSEDCSLVSQPPWVNPYLLAAMALSFGLHFLVMYVPALAAVFHVVPLDGREWLLVLAFSVAVVAIDEVLKFVGREFVNKAAKQKRD
ncbi:calcium-transporting ATPase [Aureococcus anophagefferens]|uniref:Calcium-transporting ATPase n=1 Tax=Aureococcus anophagefferens TaxID=44056 RepID=A0ABR1G5P9_AURAN